MFKPHRSILTLRVEEGIPSSSSSSASLIAGASPAAAGLLAGGVGSFEAAVAVDALALGRERESGRLGVLKGVASDVHTPAFVPRVVGAA